MPQIYKVPLVLAPQPEGGYTVTSPVLPELVTEGDSVDEALEQVRDALKAVIEIYEDLGKPLPVNLQQGPQADSIWFAHLITSP
jgi:antitoxin HicB